ncbi:MAG TPA: penicillin-binding protein activator LpoB [Elusimicrobiales bacterium]|nr:penicillin-binding protein activator LpoB [Elusimicrobiales bacterium]
MNRTFVKLVGLVFLVSFLSSCGTKVRRIDVKEQRDLSGRWNDTDSRLTAEAMIKDCLEHRWYRDAKMEFGGKPVVIVGTISNLSSEHINTSVFIQDLQRALINSNKVDFVASSSEREEIRDERLEQDINASELTRKPHGEEIGADYMLKGVVNSIEDKEGRKKVVLYQVNLKLYDLKTNKIVWVGESKFKKYIKKALFGL